MGKGREMEIYSPFPHALIIFSLFPHFLSIFSFSRYFLSLHFLIFSQLSHSLPIFSQPGCQAATSCATLVLLSKLVFFVHNLSMSEYVSSLLEIQVDHFKFRTPTPRQFEMGQQNSNSVTQGQYNNSC